MRREAPGMVAESCSHPAVFVVTPGQTGARFLVGGIQIGRRSTARLADRSVPCWGAHPGGRLS